MTTTKFTMPTMPTEEPIDNYGSYGDNLLGNYDIEYYLYQAPLEVDI